jgi:biotin synthase
MAPLPPAPASHPHSAKAWLRAEGSRQEELFALALAERIRVFDHEVFVRGVLEVSNFCRQNCFYCGMRRDNRTLHRYRIEAEKLIDLIVHHRPASITDINIQAGEDPVAVREIVLPLVRAIRRDTPLGVSVCLGTLSTREYAELREAGASFYIIKLETGDAEHYRAMNAPGRALPKRLEAIRHLAATGWAVSSGLIAGLPGQSDAMLAATLDLLADLPLAGNSVSPFIPGTETPFLNEPAAASTLTLNCVALMRIRNPERIIPAVSAMNLVGKGTYAQAIRAGANLATINLTPAEWRDDYLLYTRDRYIMDERRVLDAIDAAGCRAASRQLLASD